MTIQVEIKVLNVTGPKDLVIMAVTEHGIQRAQRGAGHHGPGVSGPWSVYDKSALLLCEGWHDYSDDCAPEDQYGVENPLDKYLKREFPTIPLQDELRQKLAAAEADRERFRKERDDALRKLSALKAALEKA